jgi:CheY-like chemotaxis protein
VNRTRTARVLVVEDDPGIRDVVCDALLLEGFHVLAAGHGAAALEAIGRLPEDSPDVIVLDVRMPVMDGAEFVRRYRQTPGPHAAVLLLTAADDPAGHAAALRADGGLAKPFDLEALLELVERSVRARTASAQRPILEPPGSGAGHRAVGGTGAEPVDRREAPAGSSACHGDVPAPPSCG